MNKGRKLSVLFLTLLITLSVIWGSTGSAFAAGGDGSGGGSGSGGNSAEPLTLVSVTPASGTTDVAPNTSITLEFSKNIAYATVRDGNIKAVSLWSEGTQVPAEVAMADDQVQPELKNFITITPKEPLKEKTEYAVKVDTTLTSKSGNGLTVPIELKFTTSGSNTATDATENLEENSKPSVETQTQETFNSSLLIFVEILAVALIGIVAFVLLKRKKLK